MKILSRFRTIFHRRYYDCICTTTIIAKPCQKSICWRSSEATPCCNVYKSARNMNNAKKSCRIMLNWTGAVERFFHCQKNSYLFPCGLSCWIESIVLIGTTMLKPETAIERMYSSILSFKGHSWPHGVARKVYILQSSRRKLRKSSCLYNRQDEFNWSTNEPPVSYEAAWTTCVVHISYTWILSARRHSPLSIGIEGCYTRQQRASWSHRHQLRR